MPVESHADPRVTLVREKYFSLRPKPLERWLWAARAPGSAERVFWFHWDLGHQNGTWLSQVPIRIVARECGLDVATVTRAYQWLKAHGLIRRVDPGRDEGNPFQQATALTEVFAPRELVQRLNAEPSRRRAERAVPSVPPAAPAEPAGTAPLPDTAPAPLSRRESAEIMKKLSDGERSRLYAAQRDRRPVLEFDAGTRLTTPEQAHVLHTLALVANARPTSAPRAVTAAPKPRTRLSVLQLVATRAQLLKAKGEGDSRPVDALLREVAWSVEEGSLAKFDVRHAIAIACKTVREGRWSTPYRMPPDWRWKRALPELCSDAGQ